MSLQGSPIIQLVKRQNETAPHLHLRVSVKCCYSHQFPRDFNL